MDRAKSHLDQAIACLNALILLLGIPPILVTTPTIPIPERIRRSINFSLSKVITFLIVLCLSIVHPDVMRTLYDILLFLVLASTYSLPGKLHKTPYPLISYLITPCPSSQPSCTSQSTSSNARSPSSSHRTVAPPPPAAVTRTQPTARRVPIPAQPTTTFCKGRNGHCNDVSSASELCGILVCGSCLSLVPRGSRGALGDLRASGKPVAFRLCSFVPLGISVLLGTETGLRRRVYSHLLLDNFFFYTTATTLVLF